MQDTNSEANMGCRAAMLWRCRRIALVNLAQIGNLSSYSSISESVRGLQ